MQVLMIISVAFALGAIGLLASSKLKLPSIVFYLVFGILAGLLLGSTGFGIIESAKLNNIASGIIGPVVGLIIFEGAMALDIKKLRETSKTVVNLIVFGMPITIALIAVLAHYLFSLDWVTSLLIGAILSVTGPTVITPLFKRIDVLPSIKRIMSAEGIIADVVGAVISILLLEFILTQGATTAIVSHFVGSILIGSITGFITGWLAVTTIRLTKLKDIGPAVAITFATALIAYAIPEYIYKESGIISTAVAGLVMGNMLYAGKRACLKFKSELVTLAISMVFVVLAATIDLSIMTSIGWMGIVFAFGVIILVRPLMVFTVTCTLVVNIKEKLYIAFTGPRGIVAASVASLAAVELSKHGMNAESTIIKALVFGVIIISVAFVSFIAKPLAKRLGVIPMKIIIIGANAIGFETARFLEKRGDSVTLIDIDRNKVDIAEGMGFEAYLGDATDEKVLRSAGIEDAQYLIVITSSDSKNLMIAQIAKSTFKIKDIICLISMPSRMEAFSELGIKAMSPTISAAQTIESIVHHSSALCLLGEKDLNVIADQLVVSNPMLYNKSLKELMIPKGAIISLIRRAGNAHIPLGDFVLKKGDVATVFSKKEELDNIKRLFQG